MDYVYRPVDFTSDGFSALMQRTRGDGGVTIGGLVFANALERFAERPVSDLIRELTDGRGPDSENVGGPAIVSLINTAQLCPDARVRFFGAVGTDEAGSALERRVRATSLDLSGLTRRGGATPATFVLSDPAYADGHGERTFINQLGVAADLEASDLPDEFYRANIVQLGGTALVPKLHDALPEILDRARRSGALTVVNTVYDFRAESEHPGERWTLGSDAAYPLVDLLIADLEEARRLTGTDRPKAACEWFLRAGVTAAVITNGPEPVVAAVRGPEDEPTAHGPRPPRFALDRSEFPVFTSYGRRPEVRALGGDTTGCGDNFAGGVVAGIARHLAKKGAAADSPVNLGAAIELGIASGAFCLTHLGGTYIEREGGEKLGLVERVARDYGAEQEAQKRS